jgi:two-component system, NtrC family, sensor kinase
VYFVCFVFKVEKMISFLRDLSLRTKIFLSFMLIVICGTTISTLLGSNIIKQAMLGEALKQIHHGLQVADMVYAGRIETVRKSIVDAAGTERLAEALNKGNSELLPQILDRFRNENNLHFFAFVDAKSHHIFRASQGGVAPSNTNPATLPDFLAAVMADKKARAGTEVFSREMLLRENPALAERARIKLIPEPDKSPGPREVSDGMVLIAAAPVNTSSGFTGVLYGGILLNRDSRLITQINDFVFGPKDYTNNASGVVSIFMKDIRVATNVLDDSGHPEYGTHIPEDINRNVVLQGNLDFSRAFVAGSSHQTACKPIRDHRNQVIGILGIGLPENPFLDVRTSMMLTFLLVAGIGVLVVLGITYFITRSMIHPLEEMVRASNRIAAGDLDHSVGIVSRDEIGILANSYNKMLASIKTMKVELEEWGRTLEEKVNKRTEELVTVRTQMVQSEKLASIGRLAAGVAHEINNPLAGILTFSMLALEDCDDDHPMKPSLEVIVKQTLRCRETVKGLLDFARQSSAAPSITDVNSIVDKTLLLLENQTIFQNIKTVRNLRNDLPNVFIDAGELQQVVVNIVINAADAMEESGVLTIDTSSVTQTQEVLIRISDTGKGIPDDVLPLIFEPFFTTKKVGKGTGLGLSIVHGIITRAGGKIEVATSSKGTTFAIRLPIAPKENKVEANQQKDTNSGTGQSPQRR